MSDARALPRNQAVSFAAEVIADSSGKFCGNALRFATREQAEAYARDLAWRWTLVREWRVVESPDAVNRPHGECGCAQCEPARKEV